MKNHKQLLADFYLDLLAMPVEFHDKHCQLYNSVLTSLRIELGEDANTVQRIFERMVEEDAKI